MITPQPSGWANQHPGTFEDPGCFAFAGELTGLPNRMNAATTN